MAYLKNISNLLYTDFSEIYIPDSYGSRKIVLYKEKYYIAEMDSEPYFELKIGTKGGDGEYVPADYVQAKLVYKGRQVSGYKVYEGNGWFYHGYDLYQEPIVEPDPSIFYDGKPESHFRSVYPGNSAENIAKTIKAWLSELKFDWEYECSTKLGKYRNGEKFVWIGTPSWKAYLPTYKGMSAESATLIRENGKYRFQSTLSAAAVKCIPDAATWYILGKKNDINGYWQAETANPEYEKDFTAKFVKNANNKDAKDFPDLDFRWNGVIPSETPESCMMFELATWK